MLVIKTVTSLFLILAFCACTEQQDNKQVIFPIPPEETLDSVGTFLLNADNYATENYVSFFETHFNQQIANNNLDSAARLLALAGYQSGASPSFDSVWFQKQNDFLSKYAAQIKPRFRTTLYNNLGDMLLLNGELAKSMTYLRNNMDIIPKDYHTDTSLAVTYTCMMNSFINIAQYDSAIVYGQKAMPISEKYKDTANIGELFFLFAGVYKYMEQYEESEKYINKDLELESVRRDSAAVFSCMRLKLMIYGEQKSDLLNSYLDTVMNFERKWQPKNPKYNFVLQSQLARRYFRDSNYVETEKILKSLAPLFPLVQNDALANL